MSKDHWPKQPIELQPSAEARQEEKETLLLVKAEVTKANLSEIIDANKHRTWNCLLKTTARVMRFTNNCRKKDIKLMEKNITPTEMKAAKLMWKKAKVLKLIRGPDSVARGVALETIVNGSKRRLEQAVQQVYPLELRCQEEDIKDDKLSAPDGPPRHTKREAALNAKAKISTLAEDINQTDAD